jgi:hypothetical protein
MPGDMFPDRSWGPGDNPKTAVWVYLKGHPEFEIDKSIQNKLLFSVAPDGYLKRIAQRSLFSKVMVGVLGRTPIPYTSGAPVAITGFGQE